MAWRLALHTGSLGAKPIDLALQVARETGWDAVELRYVDFTRLLEAGTSAQDALGLVRASGLPVAALGVAGSTPRARLASGCWGSSARSASGPRSLAPQSS